MSDAPVSPEPLLHLFDPSPEGRVLLRSGDALQPLLPEELESLSDLLRASGAVSRGGEGDTWAELKPDVPIPDCLTPVSRRELPQFFDYGFFNRVGIAYQMRNLHMRNLFCGACGAAMRDHAVDRARECPACGNVVYPVLSPAVIVAVERDGMLLMGHGVNFPPGRYSVLAGFVDPGETLEEAVVREIFEEARVRVKNVRYFGSQPWPFPNSMMFGFRADWESGDPAPGDGELTDVRWFAPKDLPDMPPSVSISRRLIDDWLSRHA